MKRFELISTDRLPHFNSVALPPETWVTRPSHPTGHHVCLILPSKHMSHLSPSLHLHCACPGPRRSPLSPGHRRTFSSRYCHVGSPSLCVHVFHAGRCFHLGSVPLPFQVCARNSREAGFTPGSGGRACDPGHPMAPSIPLRGRARDQGQTNQSQ